MRTRPAARALLPGWLNGGSGRETRDLLVLLDGCDAVEGGVAGAASSRDHRLWNQLRHAEQVVRTAHEEGEDLGLELRRERSSLSPACPVALHLIPHTDSLLVGSRPLLRCPPVRGKSRF